MIFIGKVGTRKRGKTWQYYFQLASVDGTRKWKTGSGYRTKAEAQAAGTKALAEYNSTGIAFKVSEQSVADYFDYWMEHYVEQELAETTINTYKKRIRLYIKPYIGSYKLTLPNKRKDSEVGTRKEDHIFLCVRDVYIELF